MQFLAIPQDTEGIRPQPIARRLHHRQRRGGGDRRIHRIAPLLHHQKPCLRGQWLRGRDDIIGNHGGSVGRVDGIVTKHSCPLLG